MGIPSLRHRHVNEHTVREGGDYVLYWMTAFRRPTFNFALQHAIDRANQFNAPLVILEAIRVRYRWASDRMHAFVIEGMRQNAEYFSHYPVTYYPYVEPKPGHGTPLLHRLAKNAVTTVTDDYPCFFLPRMIDAVKERIPSRLELIDSNTIVPMRQADRTFTVAHSYRRWMQKQILEALANSPRAEPLEEQEIPSLSENAERKIAAIQKKHSPADFSALIDGDGLEDIPIEHDVKPSPVVQGGYATARSLLQRFLKDHIDDYGDERNHPDEKATTGLSPHLHFGHISAHEVVHELLDHEDWTPNKASKPNGKNHGFWNTSESAEGLLDQILTWREMGFNMTHRHPDTYDRFDSLPEWAQKTLAEHGNDERPYLYSLEEFEEARTHDDLWNAAQTELRENGIMHNYMRMLWGKKILHWTKTPHEALDIMEHLNNKYGLDGRDPNSYGGIFWVLGRYDRAWGPKRPIFGSVRYMTSDSTRKKLRLKKYLKRFGDDET